MPKNSMTLDDVIMAPGVAWHSDESTDVHIVDVIGGQF
jgi:hypothetical protein